MHSRTWTAHALFKPMVNRADLEVDGLKAAEGLFDLGQALVAAHCLIWGERSSRHAGAQDVDARPYYRRGSCRGR